MLRIRRLSGWKCAWVLSWVSILGLMGLTVAELSQYGGIVQFYGDSLIFVWDVDQPQHHYRIHLTEQDLISSPSVETNTILYSQEPTIEVETWSGHTYHLRVQSVSEAGDTSDFSVQSPLYICLGRTGSGQVFGPGQTALGPSYPNPFNAATTIPFIVASESGSPVEVSLKIYNSLGQVVTTLVDENRLPGQYRAIWNGHSDQGAIVSAGTYICLLEVGDCSSARTLVFAK